ncbi:MAG: ATP-dependent DNA helicase [Alphaproteobacteria bacterium]
MSESLVARSTQQPAPLGLAQAWGLAVRAGRSVLVSRDGEVEPATPAAINKHLAADGLIVTHAPFVWRRMGARPPQRSARLYDLAELYAFAHPARFATPTSRGIAHELGLLAGPTLEDEAALTHRIADRLLADIAALQGDDCSAAAMAAAHMARAGWAFAPEVTERMGVIAGAHARFEPWRGLKEWEEAPPRPEPGARPLAQGEARATLDRLLARALPDHAREARGAQADYAESAASVFAIREREHEPHLLLAEAGTGIGKTLGYLAPSALWARRNDGTVWISTYTKNLQRQIAQTLARVTHREDGAPLKSVVRKGRENYACLLNIQEAAMGLFDGVGTGLVGRWLQHTKDGDMVGGDFPAWLAPLIAGPRAERGADAQSLGLTDRRGECIFGGCAHYKRCFIERVRRRTESAEIVVANHALVLTRAAEDAALPDEMKRRPLTRLVLDEGHHLFDAADSAFSAHLTASEMSEMRRWIRGYEDRARTRRGRTLIDRVSDLMPDDTDAEELLQGVLRAAHALPSDIHRSRGDSALGPGHRLLAAVEAQILARSTKDSETEFGLECDAHPASEEMRTAGAEFSETLKVLEVRLRALARRLDQRLSDEADDLDSSMRGRLESVGRSIMLRAQTISAWRGMLASLETGPAEGFVDWLSLERGPRGGDAGMHRHHLDPTVPLAHHLYRPAHGALVTSATLFDTPIEGEATEARRDRTGTAHLAKPAPSLRFPSPFPYVDSTRFIVVRDVDLRNMDQLASAMRVLFQASGGGALGLFTSIARLRGVYKRIAAPLEGLGLPLYAQHIDDMDTGTLVDIFRFETDSCLLGTDAVRDGIDVPGRSLRLIVLERVPWARPDILHRERLKAFGGRGYEEEIVRRRISQAFGRLIRRESDRGVFVLLGAQTPTRLLAGLPPGIEIIRTGLADAAARIHEFVGNAEGPSRLPAPSP